MMISIQYMSIGGLYFQIQLKNSNFLVDLLSPVKGKFSMFHERISSHKTINAMLHERMFFSHKTLDQKNILPSMSSCTSFFDFILVANIVLTSIETSIRYEGTNIN